MARDPFRRQRPRRLRRLLLGAAGLLAAGAAAVPVFGPALVADRLNPVTAAQPWHVSDEAAALHARLSIADLHADPLLWDRDLASERPEGHVDLPRLDRGNVAVQVFTTVTKSPRGQNYATNTAEAPDNITPLVIGQLRPVQSWFSLKERALDQAARLRRLVGSRLTKEGVLVLFAQNHRSQELNRRDAEARLLELIRQAAREAGALTIALANNPGAPLLAAAQCAILLDTGPEIISGFTGRISLTTSDTSAGITRM